ncbi:tyrosine-type recombinase/integrase [Chloroflexota bacterium]
MIRKIAENPEPLFPSRQYFLEPGEFTEVLPHRRYVEAVDITDEAELDRLGEKLWGEATSPQAWTRDVAASLVNHKRHKRVKEDTLETYKKRFAQFEREFPVMPLELDPLLDYLGRFNGETGRHKRNQQDLLNMLYKHALRFFSLPRNPLEDLDRPQITKKAINALSLDETRVLDTTPETLEERAALDMLLGHGWRQIEVRRILTNDISGIRDGLIWCRGKERAEWAPILPETEEKLKDLARGLEPGENVLLSQRLRRGRREPLGEDGMAQLISRLYARAGITGRTGHDLRRTFATMVTAASGDEFLAMRLIRDKIPGQSDRYIHFPMPRLREALGQYSPLQLAKQNEKGPSFPATAPYLRLVETGESRTPPETMLCFV